MVTSITSIKYQNRLNTIEIPPGTEGLVVKTTPTCMLVSWDGYELEQLPTFRKEVERKLIIKCRSENIIDDHGLYYIHLSIDKKVDDNVTWDCRCQYEKNMENRGNPTIFTYTAETLQSVVRVVLNHVVHLKGYFVN